jgi:hypothetical protein
MPRFLVSGFYIYPSFILLNIQRKTREEVEVMEEKSTVVDWLEDLWVLLVGSSWFVFSWA